MAGEDYNGKGGDDLRKVVVTGRSQANGYFTISRGANVPMRGHQIQIAVRDGANAIAVPTAGSLTIKAKTPGASEFESFPKSIVDLTNRNKWILMFDVYASDMEITPTGLDADKTFDLIMVSGDQPLGTPFL